MSSILLKNGNLINVEAKKIERGDLLVREGKIHFPAGGEAATADETIDLGGAYVSPGFIDGHIHIESSTLTPLEFSREAVKRGTTSLFVDPHEIANVLGVKGVRLFLEQADVLPLTMNIGIPSCVPATDMETAGGEISLEDIRSLLADERVYGLAEMMNFPGIVRDIGEAREKVSLAIKAGKIVDGHAPGLTGDALKVYISNGGTDWEVKIGSDHECTTPAEALEKWESGMYIMLRHGSASKDLENILPEICGRGICLDKFGLVSDDLSASDLRKNGHMDNLIGIAARIMHKEIGGDFERAALEAIAMATLNHANYFRKRTGRLSEGAVADIAVFDSLEKITPKLVISRGKIVVRDGKYTGDTVSWDYSPYSHPVVVKDNFANKLVVTSKGGSATLRVIGVKENSLLTEELLVKMPVNEGVIRPSVIRRDYKIAVLERHKGTGNISVGFVQGLEFLGGAIASTVAHDSHNLIVLGADEASMIKAVNRVKIAGGGLAAVFKGREEVLPLELAGLMSVAGIDEVLSRHEKLMALVNDMGFDGDPFLALSFLALPVIPKLKITDKGLVDVEKFKFVDLFV